MIFVEGYVEVGKVGLAVNSCSGGGGDCADHRLRPASSQSAPGGRRLSNNFSLDRPLFAVAFLSPPSICPSKYYSLLLTSVKISATLAELLLASHSLSALFTRRRHPRSCILVRIAHSPPRQIAVTAVIILLPENHSNTYNRTI